MFRRLPPFRSLTLATVVGLFALTTALTAQPPKPAAEPFKAPAIGGLPVDGALVKRSQEENLKLFKRFSEEVLRLAQKWEKSDSNEDKERAKSLRSALKLIEEKGVEKLFKELIEGLGQKNLDGSRFQDLLGKDKRLMDALEQILGVLETEDEMDRIRREIADLKEAIARVQKLKRDQENVRARTDNPKADPNKLAKDQNNLAKQTQDTADALNKTKNGDKNGDPKAGAKQDPKSEVKPTDAKDGMNAGEAKPDTPDSKSDGKPSGMENMGMPMAGDPKAGDGKPMSGGMEKPGGDKPSDPKSPMGGMDKPGDPKPGDPKTPPMGNDPKNPPMGGDQKPMGGQSKPQDTSKGDSKPSQGMPNAGESKPMQGGGMPMDGMPPMGGQPQAGSPKPGGQPPMGGQQPQNPNQPKDPAGENVQQAVPQQQDAEDNIKKGDNQQASKSQDNAIQQLQKALEELEKRLKQLREKELEKLLANLEERVGRMLRMQIEVKAATEGIDKTITAVGGGKPPISEIQKSAAEAEKEGAIIAEAEKTLKLMEGEGTAVVFAGILNEVKGDMEAIQKRLNEARVGADTQQIEQDVIDQLTMMKEALKKAKQDLENKPKDGKPGEDGGKDNKKLLDLINELKLIKAQQEQVNNRTIMHNKKDPGEQAKDPLIQAELRQLSERQKKLQDMLHKIATQANQ